MMLPKYFSCWLLRGFLYSSSYAQDDPFDDPDVNPFDWLKEIDETEFDEEGAEHHIDQRDWKKGDWQDQFKEHEALYNEKNATEKRAEAYQLALQEGINMPQRYGQLTYDPESENVYIESDQAYTDRLHGFLETLEDELSEEAKILALEALYVALEPVLTALKAKNAAILEAIIPPMGGVPAYDPVEENVKEKREGKRNFTYWIKLAAENVMQNIFKKNAEGKYELQREQLQLLQQVGVVRYLKMTLTDWELAQSFGLEVPDELLSYASAVRDIYTSAQATVGAGKALYQSLTALDTDLDIPTSFAELKDDAAAIFANKLTTQEMVNTRRKLLAKTYQQLAVRYRDYGEDLNHQSQRNEFMKMSDSDRIRVAEIAQEYLSESLRLQAKAEDLVKVSLSASGPQDKDVLIEYYQRYQKVDAVLSP